MNLKKAFFFQKRALNRHFKASIEIFDWIKRSFERRFRISDTLNNFLNDQTNFLLRKKRFRRRLTNSIFLFKNLRYPQIDSNDLQELQTSVKMKFIDV